MSRTIAVLLTCHNRREKTLSCLRSLFDATLPENYQLEVFLVDDGSSDGTDEAVKKTFPQVNIIRGNGHLFWAGGMRMAWNVAQETRDFDFYLLLNDDVILFPDYFQSIRNELDQSINKDTIYSGATIDKNTNEISYGALKLKRKRFLIKTKKVIPNGRLLDCDMTNANILLIGKDVINGIGIFDSKFTHGIADYDYSLRAKKAGFKAFLLPKPQGFCSDDHRKNWVTYKTLMQRIQYLKSPKGLAYSEYLFYIKRHFPTYLPFAFILLWTKTFFPILWEKFK